MDLTETKQFIEERLEFWLNYSTEFESVQREVDRHMNFLFKGYDLICAKLLLIESNRSRERDKQGN